MPYLRIILSISFMAIITCFLGCATTNSTLLPIKETFGDEIHIVIDDRNVANTKYGKIVTNNLKEILSKSFNQVSIKTAYGEPRIGDILIIPQTIDIKTIGKKPMNPWKDIVSESKIEISVVTHTDTKYYSISSKGYASLAPIDDYITSHLYLSIVAIPLWAGLGLPISIVDIFLGGLIVQDPLIKMSQKYALSGAAISFSNMFTNSDEMISYAYSLYQEKSQPCALTLEEPLPRFSDAGSLMPNNALDAGEQAEMTVVVSNMGKGTAFDTSLEVVSDSKDISFDKSIPVGHIPPGEKREVKVDLKAGLGIDSGKARLEIFAKEKRGYDTKRVVLNIPTAGLVKPALEIASTEIGDGSSGLASGNGNGIIESGETVELTVFIRNNGKGKALGVNVTGEKITSGISWERNSALVGAIDPGETAKAKLAFSVPRTFSGSSIEPVLKVTDVRGVGSTGKTFNLSFSKRAPILQYAYQVYNRGNPVATLTNGEEYEIEFTVSNTGQMAGRDITMALSTASGVSLSDSSVSFGEIEEKSSRRGRRISFSIPRTYAGSQLPVQVQLSQADFQSAASTIQLPVEVKGPRLSYKASIAGRGGSNILQQGEEGVLEINVMNTGSLAAEGVNVSIESRDQFLRIIGTKKQPIGTVQPNSTSETVRFKLSTSMRIDKGDKPVDVSITQKDFSPLTSQYVVNIREVGATVVDVASEDRAGQAAKASSGAAGPVISLKGSQGSGSMDADSYSLKLEASDRGKIDRVSVTVNGRNIPLGTAVTGLATGRIEVMKDIPLEVGANTIVITAYNSDNQVSSKSFTITRSAGIDVDRPPMTGMSNPDAVAVIIGISKYRDKDIPGVDYAVRDARTMKEYLVKTLGFQEKNILEAYDEDALLSTFQSIFPDELRSRIVPGKSDVFIYYSGHGVPDLATKEAFFAPYDFRPSSTSKTGYALKDFYNQLERLGARSTTIVIDACFSGSYDGGMLVKSASPVFLTVKNPVINITNCTVFTSSTSQQISSWYHQKKHGLFTYYFLLGLQGKADVDNDGQVTVYEMESYLEKNVSQQARLLYNREQTPEISGAKDRVVARLKQ